MQAYYEIETDIPSNHHLQLQLPDSIPVGRVKIAVIYELTPITNNTGLALKNFLHKYQTENIDIDTAIFEENRKIEVERDFSL